MCSHHTQLEESYAWGKFVVWLTANCTPASSRRIALGTRVLHSVNIIHDDRRDEGIVAVVSERDIKIIGNGNKPSVWQLKRYLVTTSSSSPSITAGALCSAAAPRAAWMRSSALIPAL